LSIVIVDVKSLG